mmetsp:Transcript_9388/g.20472  ORF Transcript_9388/g.20472 Transcript_9388/m.20472 type:complete len:206 (-) Transcript_9388:17-634(-)
MIMATGGAPSAESFLRSHSMNVQPEASSSVRWNQRCTFSALSPFCKRTPSAASLAAFARVSALASSVIAHSASGGTSSAVPDEPARLLPAPLLCCCSAAAFVAATRASQSTPCLLSFFSSSGRHAVSVVRVAVRNCTFSMPLLLTAQPLHHNLHCSPPIVFGGSCGSTAALRTTRCSRSHSWMTSSESSVMVRLEAGASCDYLAV